MMLLRYPYFIDYASLQEVVARPRPCIVNRKGEFGPTLRSLTRNMAMAGDRAEQSNFVLISNKLLRNHNLKAFDGKRQLQLDRHLRHP